jgi:hypothetical protein
MFGVSQWVQRCSPSRQKNSVFAYDKLSLLSFTSIEGADWFWWNRNPAVVTDALGTELSLTEKNKKMRRSSPSLSAFGPFWKEWHTALVQAEGRILRQLGFSLYWIPDQHPHKYLVLYLGSLELALDGKLAQGARHYCNDAFRLDLCLRYESQVIACSAIHLAALDQKQLLPVQPVVWWQVLCGHGHEAEMSQIANAILGLIVDDPIDVRVASCAMIASMVAEGSFNDPESFVWEYAFAVRTI